ncbi:hypothetical protein [uncultured Eudoraea sp.]|uniref:hypothetical protein n=1 Tax=uncultured Eudoraea sp. TaxID=1035614 RepID=UPI00261013E6|nr:hypothetical protein [uncultured Eudoraea sp.]
MRQLGLSVPKPLVALVITYIPYLIQIYRLSLQEVMLKGVPRHQEYSETLDQELIGFMHRVVDVLPFLPQLLL